MDYDQFNIVSGTVSAGGTDVQAFLSDRRFVLIDESKNTLQNLQDIAFSDSEIYDAGILWW